MAKSSEIHSHVGPRQVGSVALDAKDITSRATAQLAAYGIHFPAGQIREMVTGLAMDNAEINPLDTLTGASVATPVQFLQNWLPGFVRVLTAARRIDTLTGISTVGSWEDEEVVQGVLEPVGTAVPYTDTGNVSLASWNVNYERRTVVAFESGMSVGLMEEARTARARISTAAEKRTSAALSLDITRNLVGFYGYNNGSNRTYGFLNDPALPAYVSVPAGTGGTTWDTKTFLEITGDIRMALARLRVQSQDNIDPKAAEITLALPTSKVDYLSVTSQYGNSVQQWINENYPRLRVVSAPELDGANGGADVAYFYAESVEDGATDDSRTFTQIVPAKFFVGGVEKRAKSYIEVYSNATAGVMTKRPYAVVRLTGI